MKFCWISLLCLGVAPAHAATIAAQQWTKEFGEAMLAPAAYPNQEHTSAVLLTANSGRIRLIGSEGQVLATMRLTLPATASAIPVVFDSGSEPVIVAADVAGSIYCFHRDGRLIWKYARDGKATDFRHLTAADIDGDGHPEIILTDSRGHLFAVDKDGRLKLEITTTTFRLSTAAVADLDGDGRAELVFGTEDNEVYAVRSNGTMLWHAEVPGRVGRALPRISELEAGKPEVLISTPFVGEFQGLLALDGKTGALRWKAPSLLQSYESILVADLNGDGVPEVLYGDKSTRVFCVNRDGKREWATQLDGSGIFFAPAAAKLGEHEAGVLFQVVRAAGVNGKSLYELGSDGKILEALPLNGGGSSGPLLCCWRGGEISMLVASGAGAVTQFRLAQGPGAKILGWRAPRIPLANARGSEAPILSRDREEAVAARIGTNRLSAEARGASVISFRVIDPSGAVHVTLEKPDRPEVESTFSAPMPGNYRETTTWYSAANSIVREEQKVYRAAAQQAAFELPPMPEKYREFALLLKERVAAANGLATQSGQARDYDTARAEASYAGAVLHSALSSQPAGPILVHAVPNPWAQHTPISLLNGDVLVGKPVHVRMLGNEYESDAIALTNITAQPVTLALRVAGLAAEALQFRSVPLVTPNTTGVPQEDPLPLLARDGTIELSPAETREIWLTFHSRSLRAGLRKAAIRLEIPESSEPPQEIPLEIDVSRVRLPDHFRYRHCNWLYLASIKDLRVLEATIRDAVEHGTNVFNLPQPAVNVSCNGAVVNGAADAEDRLVPKLPGAFFLIDGSVGVQWPPQCHPDSATQDRAYANGLDWLRNHMHGLGVDDSDYAVYLKDEPGLMGRDAAFEHYVKMVKRVKRANPHIQVYTNPAGGAWPDVITPLDGLVDVWCPDLHLFRLHPERFTAIFSKARNFWHYEAPSDQRRLDPLGFYRVKPWIAFHLGMNGGGYWVYSQTDYYAPDPSRHTEYGVVYPTPRGPVTTKRWEASRDGSEDYELLAMLRDAAAHADPARAKQARALIGEAVAFATKGQDQASDIGRQLKTYAPDFAQWMRYRDRLIDMAEELIR